MIVSVIIFKVLYINFQIGVNYLFNLFNYLFISARYLLALVSWKTTYSQLRKNLDYDGVSEAGDHLCAEESAQEP